MEKSALILEGGAIRGLFTAGALDYLLEQNMQFEYVASVSAGTCCALSYIAEQKNRTKNCLFPTNKSDEWIGKGSLKRGKGLIDLKKAFYEFPYKQYPFRFDKYFASKVTNEIVVTSLETGKTEFLTEKSDEKRLLDIGAASSSLPIISKAVKIDGKKYYDGGVSDSLPYERAMELGYKKIVVIQTRRLHQYPSSSKGMDLLYKAKFALHKNFLNTMLSRPETYKKQAEQLAELEKENKVFVIRPTIPEISRTEDDYNKKITYYNHGYSQMRAGFNDLQEYLNS